MDELSGPVVKGRIDVVFFPTTKKYKKSVGHFCGIFFKEFQAIDWQSTRLNLKILSPFSEQEINQED